MGILRKNSLLAHLMHWLNRPVLRRAKCIVFLDRFMVENVQRMLKVTEKAVIIPPWPHNDPAERIDHTDNPWPGSM